MMTPEEALAKAKQIVGGTRKHPLSGKLYIEGDVEGAHKLLDDLLCLILREYGYGDLVDFFDELILWYS